MTPILQTESAVIGFLPDALSCEVTEERNGVNELTLTYPVSAPMFSSLAAKRQTSLYNRKLICYYEATKRSDLA